MPLETNILPLIPQRPPFVMVDTLETCDDQSATTCFSVVAANIFIENGRLGEPALVENIAQTAAARMGYICRRESKPVPVGFIGAVQNLAIKKIPQTGDVLETTITIKNQIFNATLITGSISVNGEEIATCDMKIFIS